jgi:N-acetylneuraminate synthase
VEVGVDEFTTIDRHCRAKGITWFASVWNEPSVDVMESFALCCYKIPSATLTDAGLLQPVKATGRPIILSTGMSTMAQIHEAVHRLDGAPLVLTRCTSTHPACPEGLNLRAIQTLKREFACPVGYSGHDVGFQTACAAVALGAVVADRALGDGVKVVYDNERSVMARLRRS